MNYIIIGKSCSGKTTVKNIIEKEIGIVGYEASDIVKKLMKEQKIKLSELFEKYGKDFVAKEIYSKNQNSNIVISGFRTVEEINYFKNKTDSKIITIYASDIVCFQRSILRKRQDSKNNFITFYTEKICANYALGLAKAIEQFRDYFIDNSDKNIQNLERQIKHILKK